MSQEIPSCDILIMTAGNEFMARVYDDMFNGSGRHGVILHPKIYLAALPDPAGVRIGNGGALALAVKYIKDNLPSLQANNPHLQDRDFKDLRIVVIQAGGFGSRLAITLAHATKPLMSVFSKLPSSLQASMMVE